ncbi:hypothetical protein MVEN_02197900 [Mycena venus]|uniref:DUF4139 domain-containing protein n=1 Tax=Mycena venus TaxID=2733690 RepID=A0A8H6X7J9_9AGAR|nr:hypothetical protein MVEN_02197900 [Mycena venus]
MRTLKLLASVNSIKGVTVYKSHKAEVVRIFKVDLKSGNTKIEITELPSCIDTQSVRVSGLGDARLFDVVCTTRDGPGPWKSSEAVRRLKAQKLALEGEKRVRDHESDLLVSYAKTLNGEHVSPTQMGEFLQSFVEQGRKNLQAVAELDEKIVALDRQIEVEVQKETTKKGLTTGEVTIVVGTDSDTHVDLKLTYIVSNASWESTYELHAATDNSKPSSSVALHYRARIMQSTGEDWNDTALTLSTVAASTVAKSIPWLNPIKIRPQSHPARSAGGFNKMPNNNANNNLFMSNNAFPLQSNTASSLFGPPPPQANNLFGGGVQQYQQLQQVQQQRAQVQQMQQLQQMQQQPHLQQQPQLQQPSIFGQPQQQPSSAFGAFGSSQAPVQTFPTPELAQPGSLDSEADDFEDIAVPNAMAGPTTIVTETPLAISYAVEGATTVPSDGTVHQVSVAVLPFEAKISHICTPRVDPRVYLQCHVKNTSEYRLLPGPVSVVLNDSFVSKTSINEINTGDTFTCTLGDDVATKVTYARSSKTVTSQGGSFQEVFNTTTYNTKITIHNKHPFALTDLVVRDIIPTCDDKRAKVLLRKPEGLADAKEGEVVKLAPPGLKVMWGKTSDGRLGEKDGRFEWAWSVDGGAKAVLEAQWELKAPADVAWVESVPVF